MSYTQNYGGIIWTNHAIRQMKNRGLSQDMAVLAFKHADHSFKGKTKNAFVYQKRFEDSRVTVIVKQNEKSQWIVLSAWMDPPLPGSPDAKEKKRYLEYQKASGIKKFWLAFKRQIGF